MTFNHIEGNMNIPGEILWEIITAYFILAPLVLYILAERRGIIKKFATIDYVYMGISATIATVWEFFHRQFLK